MIFFFLLLGDFMLSTSTVYFNSSSSAGDLRCVQFKPVSDGIVERDEVLVFAAVSRNARDMFLNERNAFTVFIRDDEGTKRYSLM